MALPPGHASWRGHHPARHTAPARRCRPRDPVAYHYREARWCAPCVIERLLERVELRDVSMSLDDEVCLDRLAHAWPWTATTKTATRPARSPRP